MTTFSKITIPLTLCLLMSAALGQAQENQPAKVAEKPEMPPFPIMRLDADGPVSRVTSLVFSPDGKTLYAAGLDKAVYAWTKDAQGKFQFASDKMLRIPIGPDTSGTINAMALSADGKYLAVGGKAVGRRFTGFKEGGLIFPSSTQSLEDRLDTGTIFVFDLSQPGPPKVMHLRGHLGIVTLLDFANAAGQTPVLVSAGEEYDPATGDQRGAVRVWDLANPKESIAEKFDLLAPSDDKNAQDKPKNLPRGIAALRTAGKQPTNVLVGIAWADNVLRVWDVANKKTVELPNQLSVACTNVGNNFLLAGGFRNGWKLGLWKPPVNGNASPTEGTPLSAGTAPIGLASASDAPLALVVSLNLQSRKVGFFLADSGNLTRQPANAADTLFGDNTVSPAYAISPAGDLVAVAGNLDKKIQIYRVNRNQAPALFQQLEGQGDLLPLVRFYRNGDSLGLGLNQNVQA